MGPIYLVIPHWRICGALDTEVIIIQLIYHSFEPANRPRPSALETGFETLGAAVELDGTKWDVVAASRFPDPEETDALVLSRSSTSTSLHVRGMVLSSRRTQCL